jgi:hypothetical protein
MPGRKSLLNLWQCEGIQRSFDYKMLRAWVRSIFSLRMTRVFLGYWEWQEFRFPRRLRLREFCFR